MLMLSCCCREAALAHQETALSSLEGKLQQQAQKYTLLEQLLTGLWHHVQSAANAQQVTQDAVMSQGCTPEVRLRDASLRHSHA
jgi:hypothetical protein